MSHKQKFPINGGKEADLVFLKAKTESYTKDTRKIVRILTTTTLKMAQ